MSVFALILAGTGLSFVVIGLAGREERERRVGLEVIGDFFWRD